MMTIVECVRQALAGSRCHESLGDIGKKLDAVREAAQLAYPTADIDEMLAQIGRDYGS